MKIGQPNTWWSTSERINVFLKYCQLSLVRRTKFKRIRYSKSNCATLLSNKFGTEPIYIYVTMISCVFLRFQQQIMPKIMETKIELISSLLTNFFCRNIILLAIFLPNFHTFLCFSHKFLEKQQVFGKQINDLRFWK